jgi:hypothetical protein
MKVEPFPFKIIALDPVFQMFGCEASRSACIRRSFRQRSIYRRKRCAFSVVAFFASLVLPFAWKLQMMDVLTWLRP